VKKRHKNKEAEFDVVAGSGDYILINETKNKLRSEDIKRFAEKVLPKAKCIHKWFRDEGLSSLLVSTYLLFILDSNPLSDNPR